jgi:quinoprotein glucose dehydrogenase
MHTRLATEWGWTWAVLLLLTSLLTAEENLLPHVPEGFVAELYAQEPLIRSPTGLCFDNRGRLFVGQGPQFRQPKPDTPGDTIEILLDTDGDGIADKTKTFAEGFNCIQGLAWKGNDLWVANAPELTVVRDLDGDDEADEYVLIWEDLGNLEHGLHGLNWAPDGKLYMSKGNSKGYSKDRFAPLPFRIMWDAPYPENAPDHSSIQVFKKGKYKKGFHNPRDDWGRTGGIFRCDDMGENPEIIALGLRNPWDITFDEGFNFIGSDNDQDGGDKIFMPFYGAHFGWGHPWSYDWRGVNHPPTVRASGPFEIASSTGTKFYNGAHFPPNYRNVFFMNDWGTKTTFVLRPRWDGALIRSQTEEMEVFARPKDGSLFAPTDLEIGPDGALYCGGWGRGYGVEWKDGITNGEMINKGRIFRFSHRDYKLRPHSEWETPKRAKPYAEWTFEELVEDLEAGGLPIWRVDAQVELVRRGTGIRGRLLAALEKRPLSTGMETYLAWTLGRLSGDANHQTTVDGLLRDWIGNRSVSLNRRIQALRILAHRAKNRTQRLPKTTHVALEDPEPRVRFDAVQAIWQSEQKHLAGALWNLVAVETDEITYYAAWNALRHLAPIAERKQRLTHHANENVRFAALMTFLGTTDIAYDELIKIVEGDPDPKMQEWALRWVLTGTPGKIMEKRPARQRGLKDVAAVAAMIRKRAQTPIRKFLIALLPKVEDYDDEGWKELNKLYKELGRGAGLSRDEHIAFIGAFAHHSNSVNLLWDNLTHADDAIREAAIDGFVELGEPGRAFLGKRLNASGEERQQRGAITALDRYDHTRMEWRPRGSALRALAGHAQKSDDPTLRSTVLRLLLAADWTLVEVARELVEEASNDPAPRVYNLAAPLAERLGANITMGEKPKAATIADVTPLVAGAEPANGHRVFTDQRRANCVACHQVDGIGAQFAPPLSDAGIRMTRDQILESILKPSARITEGYHVNTIVTKTGEAYLGVVRNETDNTLELFQADARSIKLQKEEIVHRGTSPESIMPPNIGELLSAQEIADLAAWLMTRKTKPVDPQKGG